MLGNYAKDKLKEKPPRKGILNKAKF